MYNKMITLCVFSYHFLSINRVYGNNELCLRIGRKQPLNDNDTGDVRTFQMLVLVSECLSLAEG